ncbi:MAG TPA: MqnA/MqnD/SBP family protein [bacterium]|jgi:chorismate dehydratase|nr:MqnA/MqnD/SBP family protein [bacterium]
MSETTANTPASPAEQTPAALAPAAAATPAVAPAATTPAATPAVAPAAAPAPPPPPVELKFTAKPMNVAVVPFLNAQPLIWQLAKHHHVSQVPPIEMAKQLKSGQIDVALAPIAAYFLDPSLTIVPIAAIGSNGPVKSVRILSHGSLKEVERLFVDSRSQTSVMLARLILKKWYGVKNLEVVAINQKDFKPNQTKPWEATLQFGDSALIAAPTGMTVTDLGEEWKTRTGKPFVYAVWMARNVQIAREIENDLLASKNEGVKHFGEIAEHYKGIWVFQQPQSKEYLEKNINYAYAAEQVQGQLEFQKLLKEEGLVI